MNGSHQYLLLSNCIDALVAKRDQISNGRNTVQGVNELADLVAAANAIAVELRQKVNRRAVEWGSRAGAEQSQKEPK